MSDDTTRGNPGGRRTLPPDVRKALASLPPEELMERLLKAAEELDHDPTTRAIYERANESLRRALEEQEKAEKEGGS